MKGKENRGELKASLCSQTLKDWAEDLNTQELGGHVILSVEVGAKESFSLLLAGTCTCTVGMKGDTEASSLSIRPLGLLLRTGGLSAGEPCLW